MGIQIDRATVACNVCGAQVSELRRGRCWGCYNRWVDMRPVGRGASCGVCGERRRDNLRLVELHNRSIPLCHNCSARVVRLSPVPPSLEDIRTLLDRERRTEERRAGAPDQRIFPRERRVGDRRGKPRAARFEDTDPAIQLPSLDELCLELADDDIEVIEQTVVRESPLAKSSR